MHLSPVFLRKLQQFISFRGNVRDWKKGTSLLSVEKHASLLIGQEKISSMSSLLIGQVYLEKINFFLFLFLFFSFCLCLVDEIFLHTLASFLLPFFHLQVHSFKKVFDSVHRVFCKSFCPFSFHSLNFCVLDEIFFSPFFFFFLFLLTFFLLLFSLFLSHSRWGLGARESHLPHGFLFG